MRLNITTQKMSFLSVCLLMFSISLVMAGDTYVSQSGTGGEDGSSEANACSLLWLNANQNSLTPGDTVHLIGTFTNSLIINRSGSKANRIKIYFEPGAKFIAPFWSLAINLSGQSYITIDGGANGLIAATNNGTLLGLTNDTIGIFADPVGSGIEIENLTISNLFLRVAQTNGSRLNQTPSSDGIKFYCNSGGANDVSVHNNNLVYCGNAISYVIKGPCTNITTISNMISEVSRGIFYTISGGGFSSGFRVANNTISNFNSYDGDWGIESGQHNHNDGIQLNSTSGHTNYGFTIAYNRVGGRCGVYMTSLIKITPDFYTFKDALVVNNILVNTQTNAFVAGGAISLSTVWNVLVANNTIVNEGGSGAAFQGISINLTATASVFNNVFKGVSVHLSDSLNSVTTEGIIASDYNLLRNDIRDSAFYGRGGETFQTISEWETHTGYDLHSLTYVLTLNTDYTPVSGSVLIGAGTNLSTFFTNDFNGNPRPAIGPWTIGAFETSRTSTGPNKPQGLKAAKP